MELLKFVQRLVVADEEKVKIGEDVAKFRDVVRKLNEEYQVSKANDKLLTNIANSFHVGS